ncbi:hypothetical protein SCAB_82431 [Streptomyces scabiei 87.22]|uniref:Uncharacterized protein n=1 Tax=Streptomyces scabiei (strain 87.22) TaxID=680198 RepID=C9YU68_STRSW|nr:hypothetical protein SCAB_82431 [Streptomyces scabiei 87.22]
MGGGGHVVVPSCDGICGGDRSGYLGSGRRSEQHRDMGMAAMEALPHVERIRSRHPRPRAGSGSSDTIRHATRADPTSFARSVD